MRQQGMDGDVDTTVSADPRTAELETFLAADYSRVVGSVSLITGDRSSAEDAVQDALVKAWKRRGEPIDRLAAWVTVVATNEARTRGRRRSAEARALEKVGPDVAHESPAPTVADDELQAALGGLALRERQVAVLHYCLDLSVADVATTLGVSDGTVKTLLSRARSHLALRLDANRTIEEGGVA